jgi:tetratricopeptide (TPR) repeat protein
MIRDFDEFGARPLRGPGAFHRPAVDERALMIFEYNFGEGMTLAKRASYVFWKLDPAAGLELVWDNVRRAERYPAMVHAAILLMSLRILSLYGPIRRSLQVARRALELAPGRGRNGFLEAAIHGEMTHLYERLGDHEQVLRHGLRALADGKRHQQEGLRSTGMFRYSQHLLRMRRPDLAIDYAQEAAELCQRNKVAWLPPARLVVLSLAQVYEALGRKQEAHTAYRRVNEHIGEWGYATRAEHNTAWDGYHRTK